MTSVLIVNKILGILTIGAQVGAVALVLFLIFKWNSGLEFFKKFAMPLSFVAALLATLGSLFYSEVAGYEPCKLCWYQRIFMYPLVFLFATAWFAKEKSVFLFSAMLSGIGGLIAGYHYLVQIGVASATSCGVVGYSVSCAQKFVMQFGYITIPMMAFSAFVFVFAFSLLKLRSR